MAKLEKVDGCKTIVSYAETDPYFTGENAFRRWGAFFMGRDLLEVGFIEGGAVVVAAGYQQGDYSLDSFSPDGKLTKREVCRADGTASYTASVEYQPGNKVVITQVAQDTNREPIVTSLAELDACLPNLAATRALIAHTITRSSEAQALVRDGAFRV